MVPSRVWLVDGGGGGGSGFLREHFTALYFISPFFVISFLSRISSASAPFIHLAYVFSRDGGWTIPHPEQ